MESATYIYSIPSTTNNLCWISNLVCWQPIKPAIDPANSSGKRRPKQKKKKKRKKENKEEEKKQRAS